MHSCGINNNWLMFHVEQINKSRKMFYVEQSRGEQKRALRPFEAVEKVAKRHFFEFFSSGACAYGAAPFRSPLSAGIGGLCGMKRAAQYMQPGISGNGGNIIYHPPFPGALTYFAAYSLCTYSARMALSTARTITPTSANIAAHMLAMPSAPSIRQSAFTPRANAIFW